MSDDTESAPAGRVQVLIFNQIYNLRSGDGDREHVIRVARVVDERMRLISSMLTTSDVAKVAVLAALNLAGELEELRAQQAAAPAPGEPPAERDELAATRTEASAQARRSWFEEIFDGELERKSSDERLSSRVASKLQKLRPSGDGMGGKDDDI
jgi:cell division protein ZapA